MWKNFQLFKPNNPGSLVPKDKVNLTTRSSNDGNNQHDAEVQTSCFINSTDTVVLHSILPVRIRQKGQETPVETYALYDNGSSGCFITNELKDQLNVKGSETTLQLHTMHGLSYSKTEVIHDLVVSDYDDQFPIELPKVFTKSEIPANHDQIPKSDVIQEWPHLHQIAKKIPIYHPKLNIGLLIGSNCPKALQPPKVIPTNGDGPFATLLYHGWTINGPIQVKFNSENQTLVCNRISVQEVETVKEIINPDRILRMFEMDFNEYYSDTLPNERGHSQEDLKFLNIVQQDIQFVDGHFILPLPFKNSDVQFPNNKCQAIKRANWQKRKMLTDSTYRDDYTKFIDTIITKGYAHKVPKESLATPHGKVWYLPHHGVYHPKKPNKIRVVFDCSSKFEGTSLNDQLLQSPDLTNSLIGVLNRFREEHIAFMGDIKTMFYQDGVPPGQQDFLRFLWWTDGDLSQELDEYRVAVHLFGATSSPSISNFALRKTSELADDELTTSTILP